MMVSGQWGYIIAAYGITAAIIAWMIISAWRLNKEQGDV
jgi:hypothetical protein